MAKVRGDSQYLHTYDFALYEPEKAKERRHNRMLIRDNLINGINDIYEEIIVSTKHNFSAIRPAKNSRTLNICVFDNHFGEIVKIKKKETFNMSLAAKRMDYLFDRAIAKIKSMGKGSFNEIVIPIGGDNIEGDGNIFMHQIYSIEDSPWEMVFAFVKSVIRNVDKIDKYFGRGTTPIRIYGIAGNHGQLRSKIVSHPIVNNYDTLGYMLLLSTIAKAQQNGKFKNVSLNYPISESYIDWEEKGHSFFMIHKMGKNLLSPSQKIKVVETFNRLRSNSGVHLSGHFHETVFAPVGNFSVVRVGALPGENEYSNELGICSKGAEQLLFTTTEDMQIESFEPVNMVHVK